MSDGAAIDPARLALWTPIGLTVMRPQPVITWADLQGVRFSEPFFSQTLARALDETVALGRTALDVLLTLDQAYPSLDPCGLIFHMGRCGSTVLSRLFSTVPGVLVIAEAEPINDLLEMDPALVDPAVQILVLRLLVRALGRIRFGDERQFILKLSSWNIHRLDLFQRAFPGVPWCYVSRDPADVLASVLAGPPGWMALQGDPERAARLFGGEPAHLAAMSPAEFAVTVLAGFGQAAVSGLAGGGGAVVPYALLPGAVWTELAPRFGISLDAAAIDIMRAESGYYAKDPVKRPFKPAKAGQGLAPELLTLVEQFLRPIEAALARVLTRQYEASQTQGDQQNQKGGKDRIG